MSMAIGFFFYNNVQRTRRIIVNGGSPPDISQLATGLIRTVQNFSSGDNHQNEDDDDKNNKQQKQRNTFTVVITGANTGIGKETVQQIVEVCMAAKVKQQQQLDVHIFLLCRSIAKGNQAIQDIILRTITTKQQDSNNAIVVWDENSVSSMMQVIPCDLTSFSSVRSAVQTLLEQTTYIHVLINNAGVMMKDMVLTDDGFETCVQANVLGHFLLTALLLPHVHNTHGRIVNLTSSTYRLALPTFDPDRLDALSFRNMKEKLDTNKNNNNKKKQEEHTQKYTLFGQYAATKWMNILHTRYLHDHVPFLFTAAVHPGLVRTDVVRNMPWYWRIPNAAFAIVVAALQKTPAGGAWGTLHVIVCDPRMYPSGAYWVNRKPQPLCIVEKEEEQDATVQQQAEKVWNWCCETVLTEEERKALEQFLLDNSKTHTHTKIENQIKQ
jgi:NAD(P)-dependent dehydrogenase (short-subunit alcohol dehydrogenase family)